MTRREMITGAHDQARFEARKFDIPYRVAFRNALRGFRAVAAGFRGIEIKEPRRFPRRPLQINTTNQLVAEFKRVLT